MKASPRLYVPRRFELEALAPALAALPLLVGYGTDARRLAQDLLAAHASRQGLIVASLAAGTPPVGLCWYRAQGAFGLGAYLRLLAVLPAGQRCGVGSALCAAFEEATKGARGGQLALCSAANEAALGFYAQRGYRRVGTLGSFVHPAHEELLLHRPALRSARPEQA